VYGEATLAILKMVALALWVVALFVVLPLTLFGVIHYVLIDVFIFIAAGTSLYLVYVYGTTLNSFLGCFSVVWGTRIICLSQLIPMLFFMGIEGSNIFVGTMRGSGFVAVNWAAQLFGSFVVFLGFPFVVAGFIGTVTKSPPLLQLFVWYQVAYMLFSICFSAAIMYKGPDVCEYYHVLGAGNCGLARLTELGVLLLDLVWQTYIIWVVRSCMQQFQGGFSKGFSTLLVGEHLAPRDHYGMGL
jgi:hypothetical protein